MKRKLQEIPVRHRKWGWAEKELQRDSNLVSKCREEGLESNPGEDRTCLQEGTGARAHCHPVACMRMFNIRTTSTDRVL